MKTVSWMAISLPHHFLRARNSFHCSEITLAHLFANEAMIERNVLLAHGFTRYYFITKRDAIWHDHDTSYRSFLGIMLMKLHLENNVIAIVVNLHFIRP